MALPSMRLIKEKEHKKRVKELQKLPDDTMFYWQSYGYVGNCLNLWAEGRSGYTTELSKAHLFTKEETLKQLSYQRDTDQFWIEDDLRKAVTGQVDHQNVKGKRY